MANNYYERFYKNFSEIISNRLQNGNIVDLETFDGTLARNLLQKGFFVNMIDTWEIFTNQNDPRSGFHQCHMEEIEYKVDFETQEFSQKRNIIKAKSEEAVKTFKNESVDCINLYFYGHSLIKEIMRWWPKIREDGWFCGSMFIGHERKQIFNHQNLNEINDLLTISGLSCEVDSFKWFIQKKSKNITFKVQ